MSKRLMMFDQLIASGTQDPFHHYARAMELRSLGRASDALEAFREVIRLFPDYVPSYLMAAQLAVEQQAFADARVLCEEGTRAARRTGNDHALSELSELQATLPAP